MGYSAIIFCISSLPADRITFVRFFWDKFLHTVEYTPLGISAAYALRQSFDLPKVFLWLAAVAVCFTYGLSDEFHQSFVPGRECSIFDALADLTGGAVGAGLYLVCIAYFRRTNTHVRR